MARMVERLGPEEKKVLRFIARREERGEESPGIREIGCAVGLGRARDVRDRLSGLVEEGYVVRDAGWRRMLELTGRGWRLVGELEAADLDGDYSAPEEERDGPDGELLRPRHGPRRRLLRPTPQSLIRAGMSGDDLLVVEDAVPGDGDLVVALVEGETVVKRLYQEGGLASLGPADEAPGDPGDGPVHEPCLPVRDADIRGRVLYVVRPLTI